MIQFDSDFMNFKSLNLKNQIRPGQMIYKINFTKTNKIESEIESNSNFIKILPLSQHYFNKFLKILSSMITQWLFLPPSFFISSNSDKKKLDSKTNDSRSWKRFKPLSTVTDTQPNMQNSSTNQQILFHLFIDINRPWVY